MLQTVPLASEMRQIAEDTRERLWNEEQIKKEINALLQDIVREMRDDAEKGNYKTHITREIHSNKVLMAIIDSLVSGGFKVSTSTNGSFATLTIDW